MSKIELKEGLRSARTSSIPNSRAIMPTGGGDAGTGDHRSDESGRLDHRAAGVDDEDGDDKREQALGPIAGSAAAEAPGPRVSVTKADGRERQHYLLLRSLAGRNMQATSQGPPTALLFFFVLFFFFASSTPPKLAFGRRLVHQSPIKRAKRDARLERAKRPSLVLLCDPPTPRACLSVSGRDRGSCSSPFFTGHYAETFPVRCFGRGGSPK